MRAEKISLNSVVFSDACFLGKDSRMEGLPQGLILSDLETARLHHPELFRKVTDKSDSASLNTGLFCYVQRGIQLSDPIHVLFKTMTSGQQDISNFIYLEEGAQLSIFEEYGGLDELDSVHTIHSVIQQQKNSVLSYTKLQAEAKNTRHLAITEVYQRQGSLFRSTIVSLGAQFSQEELCIDLQERQAECELQGFYHARERQVMKHHSLIQHLAEKTSSRQNYKGIARDQARAGFRGRVKVYPCAQQTNAQQSNQNLLLSSKAEIDAKPELEIYADDVKCSHGSTVGQLDEAALFYLRSRGIEQSAAQHLLSCAFAMSVLEDVSHPEILRHIKNKVVESLSDTQCCGVCQDD